MASSGTLKTTGYDGRYLKFSWTVKSQSIANNTSTVSWTLTGAGTGGSASWYKAGPFKVTINGTTVYQSSTRINLYDGTVVSSGDYLITHNTDGTKSMSVAVEAAIYTAAVNCKGNNSWDLPAISRFATITSAPDFTDEENPMMEYQNQAGNNVSTLQAAISFDGTTADISYRNIPKSGDSYTFVFTDAERTKFQTATASKKSISVYYLLKTVINGTTNIDKKKAKFQIVNAKPTVTSCTYADSNATTTAITGNDQVIIRNNSNLKVAVSGMAALKGATLQSVVVTVNGIDKAGTISGDSSIIDIGKINVSANVDATITVTDSRGFSTVKKLPMTVQNWVLPTAIITAARKNNFYDATDLTINGKYSGLGGKNTLTVQYQYKRKIDSSYGKLTAVTNNSTTTLTLDNKFQWDVRVKLTDLLGSTTYNLVVDKGVPIMFIDREKSSVGVGSFPTRENSFEVDGKTIDDYIAARVQAGTVNFNCSANTMVTQQITFPRAFAGKPRICLTANASSPQVTHLGFVSASATGFTLKYQSTVARNPAYVNWIAVLDDNSKNDSGE